MGSFDFMYFPVFLPLVLRTILRKLCRASHYFRPDVRLSLVIDETIRMWVLLWLQYWPHAVTTVSTTMPTLVRTPTWLARLKRTSAGGYKRFSQYMLIFSFNAQFRDQQVNQLDTLSSNYCFWSMRSIHSRQTARDQNVMVRSQTDR